jgi:hypothetical protein
MACRDCGNKDYPDGGRCFDCAVKKVEEWKAAQDRPIEERMARERKHQKRVEKPHEDQGALL